MLPAHRYYYLDNFQRALAWIGERYGDLLDEADQRFLVQFGQLPLYSQALMVCMLMRCGPWFRAGKLVYEEIPDALRAAEPLLALGWLDALHPMELQEWCALHTKAELLQRFGAPLHAGMRKAEMLQALQCLHTAAQPFFQWSRRAPDPAWRVMVGPLCERLRLMFFGNLHQTWSEFVLADLGIFKYEAVAFDAASRAFQTRDDVDAYLALHACRQALDEGQDLEGLLQSAARCPSCNPWIEQRRAKLLLRIGQACERAQDWPRAERAYALSRYPGARHRRMRVYELMERLGDAMGLALAAEETPESDEESQRVARLLARLRRRLGQGGRAAARSVLPAAEARMDVELPFTQGPVEHALQRHWHSEGAPVFYVENALINSLFGLLCWPAVFMALPGAFFHPFQSGPADLGAPDFLLRRAAAFDACLVRLDDGSYRALILERFASSKACSRRSCSGAL